MVRLTELDRAAIEEIAAAFALGEVRGFHPIDAGTINSNYRVDAAAGRHFLRVNEGKGEAAVAYEAELVGALAGAGVTTPVPLSGPDGLGYLRHRGHLVSVFPWVDGGHRSAGRVSVADAARVGAALADLHRAGLGLPARLHRAESIYTTADIERRFAGIRELDDPELAEVIELVGAEIEWLEQQATLRAAARRGIIHGDLFCDNVLFDGDRLVALLDFEQASEGSLAYDLAVTLLAWCYGDDFEPATMAAMVAGYRRRRSIDPAEERALYVESRAAAMRFTVTRITDVYLPGRAIAGKDFRRYLARLVRLRRVGEDGFAAWLRG